MKVLYLDPSCSIWLLLTLFYIALPTVDGNPVTAEVNYLPSVSYLSIHSMFYVVLPCGETPLVIT